MRHTCIEYTYIKTQKQFFCNEDYYRNALEKNYHAYYDCTY